MPNATGNVIDFSYGYGTSNNGNVMQWNAVGGQTFNRSYGYDSINRLASLSDTASAQPCKGLSWTYDAWGNRTDQTVTAGTCNTFHASVGSNNRLSGAPYQYDAAGNMIHDASHSYTYDAENHLIAVDGSAATYVYDARGRRVEKKIGTNITDYLYDVSGNVVTEGTAGCGSLCATNQYVYANGSLVAQYENNTTYFIHKDHLGSTRLLTKIDNSIFDNMDFLPFGEQIAGTSSTSHKFTSKERDPETASHSGGLDGLDNFGARYYGSSLGRFMTPDWAAKPIAVPYAHYGSPQSLNLYSYVQNNPTTTGDPDGHEVDLGKDKKKAQKLLLENVSKQERKMFEVVKNNDTGKYELKLKPGAQDNFHGEHTVGFTRLSMAIESDKTVTVNVSNNYTDANGQSHDVSREYGGGVTVNRIDGNSTVYVSPNGNPYQLHGTGGQSIKDPLNIIMGHETLGHGLENMTGGDTSQRKAIQIENQLRQEQNKPERAQDPE